MIERETGTEQLAVDSNPTGTAWSTEHYDSPDFGGLKDGVGLAIDAGESVPAKSMVIRALTPGYDAEIYEVTASPPSSLSGWGRPGGQHQRRRGQRDRAPAGQGGAILPRLDHEGSDGQGRPGSLPDGNHRRADPDEQPARTRTSELSVALDRQLDQPVAELRIGDAVGLEELAVDAGLGEAGDRVELVDEDLLPVDEEVAASEAAAAAEREHPAGQLPHASLASSEISAGTRSSMPPSPYLAS